MKANLEEYDMLYIVAAVVKDGGGNLAIATVVLARQGLTCCRALGAWVPHVTLCFAHKINGVCNAAVLEAKGMNIEVCCKQRPSSTTCMVKCRRLNTCAP